MAVSRDDDEGIPPAPPYDGVPKPSRELRDDSVTPLGFWYACDTPTCSDGEPFELAFSPSGFRYAVGRPVSCDTCGRTLRYIGETVAGAEAPPDPVRPRPRPRFGP